ncbi:MAG: hypothetical protein SXQ77_04490 [Halobacteria archaeon]|nr:hypothetical protein [Halobacteria archaeon]
MSVPDPDKIDEMDRRESSRYFRILWLATVVLLVAVLGSVFVLYPEVVISSLNSALGTGTGGGSGNASEVVRYTGTWEGNFGPTIGSGPSARSIDAQVTARVNFETGVIVGEIQGGNAEGSFSGTVYSGGVNGSGQINAFELISADMSFEGKPSSNWSSMTGEWNTSSSLRGKGTWELHAVDSNFSRPGTGARARTR